MGHPVHAGKISLTYPFNDSGRPPYPLVSKLSKDEVEYLTQYLDNFQAGVSSDGVGDLGEIVGYLKEFREQQESGKTSFKLPEVEGKFCLRF